MVTKVDNFSKKFGLPINKSKTEVQVINRERINITILIDGIRFRTAYTLEGLYLKSLQVKVT